MCPANDNAHRIRPLQTNPFYWQYKGRPLLLLGGSLEDNLFQIDGLEQHLDVLAACGGNYLRCTMSSRDEGNLWPFAEAEEGRYDLERWNPEYWERFARFIELTARRDIIVQVEFWATWDMYKQVWPRQPWNPRNNVTYSAEESGLPEEIDHYPFERIQPFFESVPALKDLQLLRSFQEAFVERVLACTLDYGHVLYCMDNETCAHPAWSEYWARYVRNVARKRGLTVETTEMWDNWDPSDGEVPGARIQDISDHPHLRRSNVKVTLAHPEVYTFVDISNHNAQFGQVHYETAMWVRQRLIEGGNIRPVTCVKMYGADPDLEFSGPVTEGEHRFWRNAFAGVSGCRFHRPPAGLGLSELAQSHIRSMRMLTGLMNIFTCKPRNDLLAERGLNEAYCLANPGVEYAVFFPNGGEAHLDLSEIPGEVRLQWLDIRNANWGVTEPIPAAERSPLRTPGPGMWAVLARPVD